MENLKINPKIIESLNSNNAENVNNALKKIKQDGNNAYLPHLFDLLIKSDSEQIRAEVRTILNTIKSSNAQSYFMEAIGNKKYKKIQKELLTACWQNGLEFESYLPFLIDIIIREDLETAFEAFTIVDNFEYLPRKNASKEALVLINHQPDNLSEQKKFLLLEIKKMLSRD